MIEIFAGTTALETINEKGFTQDLFTSYLAASGGPKFFTLFFLNKYLFGEFFKDRNEPLNLIGSSAGAFIGCSASQNNPVEAIERLIKYYSETVYSDKPTISEITKSARELLDKVFGDNGAEEIINNPIFKAHFIVARSKGLVSSDNKLIQMSGLIGSYLLNRVDRKLLRTQYERFIYQPQDSTLIIEDEYNFKTNRISFTQDNIKDALLASGSIPLVMEGIKDIANSPKGTYRDGGIIDYHFDFKIKNQGLVLYPHFSANPIAGWFDKGLSRKVSTKNYDNVVLICPSEKFIRSLPYGKIPDRTDFTKMDSDTRIKYWKTVLKQTEVLSHSFAEFLESQDLSIIKEFG
jgi:hypothetical protein